MSHEVTIIDVTASDDGPEVCWFGGYAEGVMYKAFNAMYAYAGVSGNGTSKQVNRSELLRAIESIKASPSSKKYPDPKRFPEFFSKVESYLSENPSAEKFEILFH